MGKTRLGRKWNRFCNRVLKNDARADPLRNQQDSASSLSQTGTPHPISEADAESCLVLVESGSTPPNFYAKPRGVARIQILARIKVSQSTTIGSSTPFARQKGIRESLKVAPALFPAIQA